MPHDPICLVFVILAINGIIAIETNEPEPLLQPRNFNPHPYLDGLSPGYDIQQVQFIQSPTNGAISKLRPPNQGIYNQGPVQFPPTNDDDTNNNNNQDSNNGIEQNQANPNELPNPYERLSLRSREKQLKRQSLDQQLDDHLTKKHYAFSYTVRDATSGDDFSHTQQQQNGAVKGSYKVQLPDGRVQVVKYTADNNGYKAEVSYLDHQGHNTVSNPTASPFPATQQPLNYYRNVQPLNQNTGRYRNPPVYNNYPGPTAPTVFIPHIDHGQVQIDTYNAGPHHQQQNVFSSSTALPAVVSTPTYVNVYPSPTPVTSTYKDIYVISSARPYIHSTPTAAVAPIANHKSTNVLSSTGYSHQFGDYDYQTDHGYRGRSVSRIWMKSGNIL